MWSKFQMRVNLLKLWKKTFRNRLQKTTLILILKKVYDKRRISIKHHQESRDWDTKPIKNKRPGETLEIDNTTIKTKIDMTIDIQDRITSTIEMIREVIIDRIMKDELMTWKISQGMRKVGEKETLPKSLMSGKTTIEDMTIEIVDTM